MFLAGDIGGTKTRLAFFEAAGKGLRSVAEATYLSQQYTGLAEILRAFLATHARTADQVCLGIAGPVRQGRVQTPNLPWAIDAGQLREELGCGPVTLLNDLEANAHGLRVLGPADFAVLNAGNAGATGNAALISAGTGLGEAGLFWDGTRHHPFASEGGHVDFAPRSPLEEEMAEHLAARFGHVSYERILSGPGLHNIYLFLCDRMGRPNELPRLTKRLEVEDPSAAISKAALEWQDDLCRKALELFVSIYGAEAGNLGLKVFATAGVYLGGGIAPKIRDILSEHWFLEAFTAKGRMRPVMEAMPVRVVLNDRAALLGAARRAADLAAAEPSNRPRP
jgi:glucokinase